MQRFEKIVVFLLLLIMAILAISGILLLLQVAMPLLWTQEAAGWVQAIGSIAAIWFSLKSVRDADQLSAKRRYDSIVALAESTEQFVNRVGGVFHDGGFANIQLKMEYRDAFIDALIDSLKAVPAQDLGSYNAILAFTLLKESLADFKGNVTRARADLRSHSDPVTGMTPFWHTWNAAALELCVKQITRSVQGLKDHRPPFAK